MPARKKKKTDQKRINLLPREDFEQTTLGRVLKWALTTFRYIVILVELVVVGGFLSRFYFDVRISDLNDDIKQQSAIIAAQAPFEQDFRNKQLKLSVLENISDDANSILPIITKVSSILPDDTRIERLTKEDEKIIVKASTLLDSSMNTFVTLMSFDISFEDVTLKSVEQIEDSPFIYFTVEADINFEALEEELG